MDFSAFFNSPFIKDILIVTLAVILAKGLQLIVLTSFARAGRIFHWQLSETLEIRTRTPLMIILMLGAVSVALHFTELHDEWMTRVQLLIRIACIFCAGWLCTGIVRAVCDWLEKRYAARASRDPLGIRRFNTQVRILMRVIITVVVVLTLIAVAVVIPGMRQVGVSLFASAGVAGLVIGVAANSTLSNLIAGIQIALTQPILLGDEVVVNNHAGGVEEITASYVVIKQGDLKRLIVPLNYFMQNPFENWTYRDPSLTGSVLLYTNYTIDIEEVRKELGRIVEASVKWDHKSWGLGVSNCKEQTLELSANLSARNSADLGDLQGEVREKLVVYLQRNQLDALPQLPILLPKAS